MGYEGVIVGLNAYIGYTFIFLCIVQIALGRLPQLEQIIFIFMGLLD